MKRFAILAVFLGLGAITLPQLASDAHVSYRVIHGWPKYDRGFTTGQVTGVAVDSHNWCFRLPPRGHLSAVVQQDLYNIGVSLGRR